MYFKKKRSQERNQNSPGYMDYGYFGFSLFYSFLYFSAVLFFSTFIQLHAFLWWKNENFSWEEFWLVCFKIACVNELWLSISFLWMASVESCISDWLKEYQYTVDIRSKVNAHQKGIYTMWQYYSVITLKVSLRYIVYIRI